MSSEFVRRQIQNLVQEEVGDNHPFTWEHFTVRTLICQGGLSGVT